MSKLSVFLAFIFGAAIGSACTFKYAHSKYEKLYQEECASMKESLSSMNQDSDEASSDENRDDISEEESEEKKAAEKMIDLKKHSEILKENGYTNYTKPGDINDDEEYNCDPSLDYKPYLVNPSDFGQEDGYEVISVIFYADQILTDDNNDIVRDVEEFVGFESLSHFGDYEDDPDSVYVRNPKLRLDIEILRSEQTYKEYLQDHPYKAEV